MVLKSCPSTGRSAIQAEIRADVKQTCSGVLKPGLSSIRMAEKNAPNAELLGMAASLSSLLNILDLMTGPGQVS